VRPGRAADHSPPSSVAVMEEESYTSTQPVGHTGPVTGSLYLYLLLIFIYPTSFLFMFIFTVLFDRRRWGQTIFGFNRR